jgi:hypothetical protein
MRLFKSKTFFNKKAQINDINEQIEETKDKLYFMYFGRNGFSR